MKVNDFISKAKDIANNYNTLYVMGCFGAPMTSTNKNRYTNNHSYNKQTSRTNMIINASVDTFGFDCVCLIKGILWGWNGNKNHVYGGAVYCSNGVPDVGADQIMNYCTNISTNFNSIVAGELVHMSGHVGIYIGNGEVVECTPAWKNQVQITKLSQRKWLNHGKLKYIDYFTSTSSTVNNTNVSGDTHQLALDVIAGKYGNGQDRKNKLGSRYSEVQAEVNRILSGASSNKKSIDEIAREVIRGNWGNGNDRKVRLTNAGYNYSEVQARVNQLLR